MTVTPGASAGGGLAIFKDSWVQSITKRGDGGAIYADQLLKQQGGRLTFQNCSAPRLGGYGTWGQRWEGMLKDKGFMGDLTPMEKEREREREGEGFQDD